MGYEAISTSPKRHPFIPGSLGNTKKVNFMMGWGFGVAHEDSLISQTNKGVARGLLHLGSSDQLDSRSQQSCTSCVCKSAGVSTSYFSDF